MEGLKQIFQRIMAKRALITPEQRESNALRTKEPEPPKCLKCLDLGFTTRTLMPGDEGFGDVQICQCRTTEAYKRKRQLAYSELPNQDSPKTFANFDDNTPMGESFKSASEFAAGYTEAKILVLCGPNGSGKSHLLEAIGRDMLDQDYRVKYVFVPDLLQKLKDTFESGAVQYSDVFLAYAEADVLLMDDLGFEKVTEWTRFVLGMLFDYRHRNDMLTVVTTNDDEEATARKQGNRLADRLFDIGSGKVRVVFNTAPSYRTGRVF